MMAFERSPRTCSLVLSLTIAFAVFGPGYRLGMDRASAQCLSFVSSTVGIGASLAIGVVAGDFNGDGKPDLAVAVQSSNEVVILLGDGTGAFTVAGRFGTGLLPTGIVTGDFNGDGKADLAVASYYTRDVTILLGGGTGSFAPAGAFTVAESPSALVAGDFNGDGRLDIATVSNTDAGEVTVLLGLGDGTFGPGTIFPGTGAGRPIALAVGDLDKDGRLDLVVANYNFHQVSILRGDGAGSFSLTGSFPVGRAPSGVAIGDLNRDGNPDLAVVNQGTWDVTVLLGDGAGSFATLGTFGVGNSPQPVGVADLDGDGSLDLVVGNQGGSLVLSILLGDGTGAFEAAPSLSIGGPITGIAIRDLDGNGTPDIAVVDSRSSHVSILLNNCRVQNRPPVAQCTGQRVTTNLGACTAPASVDAGSFDPEGDPITLAQSPAGPYVLGSTPVTLTATDSKGASSSCQAAVQVVDQERPRAQCNAPGSITPPQTPIFFTATAEDNCSVGSVRVTGYDCYFINPSGRRVDKKGSCVVQINGDTITILDSGGVGTQITWSVAATDGSGNTAPAACGVTVENPGQGRARR